MIYIVRHGQTDINKEGRYCGRMDVDLNETGIKEAHILKEKLAGINFDIVFCSPLKRAIETAKIITDHKLIIDDRLIERNNGKIEGMNKNNIPKDVNFNSDDDKYGIEKISLFRGRIYSFINDILEKYPGKEVLVVTHAGVGIYVKCFFDGDPEDGDYAKYKLENCGVAKYKNKG